MTHTPLVSVVVPVYNYDQYLGECIESVLTQTYSNWELVVVNNCSTDRSGDIAEQYAQKDPRIRAHHNTEFVDTYRNHNIACRQIAPDSVYCKVLCADDWMFPECLERMVAVAQAHPTIGIVGAYRIDGVEVGCDGLPYPTPFISGRELGRLTLLGSVGVFGSGSSVLYRSECVRARPELYDEADNHADMAACLDILRTWDFGFVHQVLTYTRRHPVANTTYAEIMNTYVAGELRHLLRYGPDYLNREEYAQCLERVLGRYYRFLALSLTQPRVVEVWAYHRAALREAGLPLDRKRMIKAVMPYWGYALTHPKQVSALALRLLGFSGWAS
jgi:glycosyltransferase involved in cell wall biosynthesis